MPEGLKRCLKRKLIVNDFSNSNHPGVKIVETNFIIIRFSSLG